MTPAEQTENGLRLRTLDPSDEVAIHGAQPWTHDDLAEAADAVGRWLDAHGVEPTGAVGVLLHNRSSSVASIAHLLSSGRCLVVCNTMLPVATMVEELQTMGIAAIVGSAGDFTAELTEALDALNVPVGEVSETARTPVRSVRDVSAPSAQAENPTGSVAIWMLTSGTTQRAKRVPITYASVKSALSASESHYIGAKGQGAPRRGRGVTIVAVPCVNISGLWGILTVLIGGGALFLLEKFEPQSWAEAVRRHEPRSANVPPAGIRMLMESDIDRVALKSLRAIWSGSAPLDPAVARRFREEFGVPVLTSYGATEFTGGIAGWSLSLWQTWGESKAGSVGQPYPSTSIRILDPVTSAELPPGETGLISICSPQANVGRPGEFIATNDLGRLDSDDFLWIQGRADDVIIRGGFKIEPVAVEEVLLTHPSVMDAAVVALPDERLGQVPAAIVVVRDPVAESELKQWVRNHMTPYSVPVMIQTVEVVPRNQGMKILRNAVVAMFTNAKPNQPEADH